MRAYNSRKTPKEIYLFTKKGHKLSLTTKELPSDLKGMMLNLNSSNYSLVCKYIRQFIKNKVHHILIESNMFVPFTMELCSWSYNFLYHDNNQWFKL